MEKPYIKHLQLGISPKELVEKLELGEDLCSSEADDEWFVTFIKMLVSAKDKNIKFVFDEDGEYSSVYAPKLKDLESLGYDYDSYGGAEEDSISLNNFIDDFYGLKEKTYKAKISSAEYKKKRGCCPACGSKKTRRDGDLCEWEPGEVRCTMGCDKCNAQWSEIYKMTGFSDLCSR